MPPKPKLYCCYLLTSAQPKQFGLATYVGFTTDPWRRIRQHNGDLTAGAKRTRSSSKRPWQLVVGVLGFPSKYTALSFESAWQKTCTSRLVRAQTSVVRDAKMMRRPALQKIGINVRGAETRDCVARKLAELRVILASCSPFCNFALEVCFASHEFANLMDAHALHLSLPAWPDHVAVHVAAGPDVLKRMHDRQRQLGESELERGDTECAICKQMIKPLVEIPMVCPSNECGMHAHAVCLAKASDKLIPTHVGCPACETQLAWPELVREYRDRKTWVEVAAGSSTSSAVLADSSETVAVYIDSDDGSCNDDGEEANLDDDDDDDDAAPANVNNREQQSVSHVVITDEDEEDDNNDDDNVEDSDDDGDSVCIVHRNDNEYYEAFDDDDDDDDGTVSFLDSDLSRSSEDSLLRTDTDARSGCKQGSSTTALCGGAARSTSTSKS